MFKDICKKMCFKHDLFLSNFIYYFVRFFVFWKHVIMMLICASQAW